MSANDPYPWICLTIVGTREQRWFNVEQMFAIESTYKATIIHSPGGQRYTVEEMFVMRDGCWTVSKVAS